MTRLALLRPSLPFAAALLLGASSALAQGTTEQREACTPDAVRLCSDTIPDVGKTTACMKRHEAELSPRCQAAFLGGKSPRTRAASRAAPPRHRTARRDDDEDFGLGGEDTTDAQDRAKARAVIGQLCTKGVLDNSTCGLASTAIDLSR